MKKALILMVVAAIFLADSCKKKKTADPVTEAYCVYINNGTLKSCEKTETDAKAKVTQLQNASFTGVYYNKKNNCSDC